MAVLETRGVTKRFGGLTAVSDLNIKVPKKGIVGLIGPNGAGKTTFFNVVTGVYEPTEGQVIFGDQDLSAKKTHVITQNGIARTFQNIRLFNELTVLDNVMVACHFRMKSGFVSSVLRTPAYQKEELEIENEALELLRNVGLIEHKDQLASTLPYGKQRKLEIARALATHPKLLLLDEPAAGMNPQESIELMHFIHELRDQYDVSILMIEHHMQVVMGVCEYIYVLDYGKVIAEGLPKEIQQNEKVIEAYLGVSE